MVRLHAIDMMISLVALSLLGATISAKNRELESAHSGLPAATTLKPTLRDERAHEVAQGNPVHEAAHDISAQDDSCNSFFRDGTNENKVSKLAIEKGMEAVQLMELAYDYKWTPGDESNDLKEKWGSDWPLVAFKDILTNVTYSKTPGHAKGSFGFSALLRGSLPVLAIAGTSDSETVYHDAKAIASEHRHLGGKQYLVAKGFGDEYQEVMSVLKEPLNALLKAYKKQVLVVGHSLGGAVATLAAVALANEGAMVMLRTAGAPRVFTWRPEDSAEDVEKSFFDAKDMNYGVDAPKQAGIVQQRWVNYGDPVPSVPLCTGGYLHVGNMAIYIYESGFLSKKMNCWGPQHQDFTPYHTADFGYHGLISYYDRMKTAKATYAK